MADAAVAPPAVGKTEPGNYHRDPVHRIDPVNVFTKFHAAETVRRSCTDVARPHADNGQVSLQDGAAGNQGGININRLKITAKSMAAGHRAAENAFFFQFGRCPAESRRQRRSIGHDVGNTAFRQAVFQYSRSRRNHTVQFTDQHRHFCQRFAPPQHLPVAGFLFLAAEHFYLPGCVAQLDYVAAFVERGNRTAEIVINKINPPRSQTQVQRCAVQQHQIAGEDRAGERGVVDRGNLLPVGQDPQFIQVFSVGQNGLDYANPAQDHFKNILFFAVWQVFPFPLRHFFPRPAKAIQAAQETIVLNQPADRPVFGKEVQQRP